MYGNAALNIRDDSLPDVITDPTYHHDWCLWACWLSFRYVRYKTYLNGDNMMLS